MGSFTRNLSSETETLHFSAHLRDYQKDCIATSLRKWQEGIKRQIISLPVASGKTVIFSELIKHIHPPTEKANKVLILAHREELLLQAQYQIKRNNPTLMLEMEKAEMMASNDADVVLASVHTLGRHHSERLLRFDPKDFKCIIIDEAHHSVADSYMRIMKHFNIFDPDSHIMLWGCSATLVRMDTIALGNLFEAITYSLDMNYMILQKWLCTPEIIRVRSSISLQEVTVSSGEDYDLGKLSLTINTPTRNMIVFEEWHKQAHLQRQCKATIVFASNVDHVNALTATFNAHGIQAASITKSTKGADRASILDACRAGRLPVLVNCGVLTEGTDIPNIDCVVLARPTQSHSLWIQMIGRGLRCAPGKTSCFIMDIIDHAVQPHSLHIHGTLEGVHLRDKKKKNLDSDETLIEGPMKKVKSNEDISRELVSVTIDTPGNFSQLGIAYHHLDWIKISPRIYIVDQLVLVAHLPPPGQDCILGDLYQWTAGMDPVSLAHNASIPILLDKAFSYYAKANHLKLVSRLSYWKRLKMTDEQAVTVKAMMASLGHQKLPFPYKWTRGSAARIISKYLFFKENLKKPIQTNQLFDGIFI